MNIQNKSFYNSPYFSANPNSPLLKFAHKDFFVNIRGYGKNEEWADMAIKTADLGANLIRRGTSGENVLKIITSGIKKANNLGSKEKCVKTGILRVNREGWASQISEAITGYLIPRYKSYATRFQKVTKNPLQAPEKKLAMTRPNKKSKELIHGEPLYINNSLDYALNKFKSLFPKFIQNDVKPENLEEINSTIAEIRWILAHATPWQRGSDSISNVFMRAMYKAMGIKTSPLAKGISLDLQAYCTDINQYKKEFTNYFEKPPIIVE